MIPHPSDQIVFVRNVKLREIWLQTSQMSYWEWKKLETFTKLGMCPVTCHLTYKHPFPAPRGQACTNKGSMCHQAPFFPPPWPAFNKLIWSGYCSLLQLKNQSLEGCRIFPEVQALTLGLSPRSARWSCMWPDGPVRATKDPLLCKVRHDFASSQSSVSMSFMLCSWHTAS